MALIHAGYQALMPLHLLKLNSQSQSLLLMLGFPYKPQQYQSVRLQHHLEAVRLHTTIRLSMDMRTHKQNMHPILSTSLMHLHKQTIPGNYERKRKYRGIYVCMLYMNRTQIPVVSLFTIASQAFLEKKAFLRMKLDNHAINKNHCQALMS